MAHDSSVLFILNIWAIPYFISFAISALNAIILVYKAEKKDATRIYLFSQLAITLTTFSLALTASAATSEVWLLWYWLFGNTLFLSFLLTYHFSDIYLHSRFFIENKKILLFYGLFMCYIISNTIVAVSLTVIETETTGAFGKFFFNLETFQSNILFSAFYGIIQASVLIMPLLTVVNFVKMFRQNKDPEMKRKASYFILSNLIILLAVVILVLTAIINISIQFQPVIISLSLSGIVISYGILKQDLFDIEILLTKRLIPYSLLTFTLTWALLLSEETLNHILADNFFGGIKTISAVFVVAIFLPIKDLMHKLTDKVLPHETHQSTSQRGNNAFNSLVKKLEDKGLLSEFESITEDLRSILET